MSKEDDDFYRQFPTGEAAAYYLWKLLDDIDTVSDIVKGDNIAYREIVEKIQRKRFEVGDADGYSRAIKFKYRDDPH